MKQNVGILDTAVRYIVAVVLLSLAAEGLYPQPVTIALFIVGILLAATASLGVCMVYKLLGIDTYPGAGHGLYQYYPREH